MRKKLVVGNWKMNGGLERNASLLSDLARSVGFRQVDVAVCVPFPYLPQAEQLLQGSSLTWGAQNMSAVEAGAHTGEVSGAMLRDFHCSWVIVGHSERRAMYGETNEVVALKLRAAFRVGLKPILCVGETLQDRQEGRAEEVVERQLLAALDGLSADYLSALVVAYEPVWAIGTGMTATPEQVRSMHQVARKSLARFCGDFASSVRLLYGGSLTAANADSLFGLDDVDGGLVGGASLNSDSFLAICAAAEAA